MQTVANVPHADCRWRPTQTYYTRICNFSGLQRDAGCSPAGTTAKSEEAPTPDYDTAKECSGVSGEARNLHDYHVPEINLADAQWDISCGFL